MTQKNEKMLQENRIIRRGEVYYANLDDAEGSEQKNDENSGRRAAVIVSNNKQNETSKVIIAVPLSKKGKLKPTFQVPTFFRGINGRAKCEQVRAITTERLLGEKLGMLTEEEMREIDKKLMVVLDLSKYLGQRSEGEKYSWLKSKW